MTIETYFPTPKQDEAHMCDAQDLLYGGAKGGGKTVWLCWDMFTYIRENPGVKVFFGRKRAKDFRESTLETWEREIPKDVYHKIDNGKKFELVFPYWNARAVCGGFDDEKAVNKFNGAEYGGAFVDQTEELSRDDFSVMKASLRQKSGKKEYPYKIRMTANPRTGWLKETYISSPAKGSAFIKALPGDNPHLPKLYIENMKETFKYRPELVRAYVFGSWDDIDGENIIIPNKAAHDAVDRNLGELDGRIITASDIARYGDDETVIYMMNGRQIFDQQIYKHRDTNETVGRLVFLRQKHKAMQHGIDSGGIGGPVVDQLIAGQEPVIPVDSGSAATGNTAQKYLNLRAEMWFHAAQMLHEGKVSIPNDPQLVTELSTPLYFFGQNGSIKVESKEDLRKSDRLGRSPDRADALLIGLWVINLIPEVKFHSQGRTPWYQQSQAPTGVGYGESQ